MSLEYRKRPDGKFLKAHVVEDELVKADVESRKRDLEREKAKYDRLLLIDEADLELLDQFRHRHDQTIEDAVRDKVAELQAEIDKITNVLAEVIGP